MPTLMRLYWCKRNILVRPVTTNSYAHVLLLQAALGGYMLLLMGLYWCTGALPLGVTSLIPVFLAPLFGFMTTKEVCPFYFKVSEFGTC